MKDDGTVTATPAPVSPQAVREIAAKAEVDVKTVKRVLAGHATKATPRARILRAMAELGVALPKEAG
jgi:DNA-binding LacI/PurR family transcriptional regulator